MKKHVIQKLESIEDAKIAFEQANHAYRVLMGMEYKDSFVLVVRPQTSTTPEVYQIQKKGYKMTPFLIAALSDEEIIQFNKAKSTAIYFD